MLKPSSPLSHWFYFTYLARRLIDSIRVDFLFAQRTFNMTGTWEKKKPAHVGLRSQKETHGFHLWNNGTLARAWARAHTRFQVCSLRDILEENEAVSLCVCSVKIDCFTLGNAEMERMEERKKKHVRASPTSPFASFRSSRKAFLLPVCKRQKQNEDRLNKSRIPAAILPHEVEFRTAVRFRLLWL